MVSRIKRTIQRITPVLHFLKNGFLLKEEAIVIELIECKHCNCNAIDTF